ncbi:zinc metalloprotease HtpX [Pseudomonadota bacterium]
MAQTMFQEIRSNKTKSYFLIFVFIILVLIVGAVIGYAWVGNIYFGLIVSFIIGFIYTIIAWNSGKKMLMGISGAKKVSKQNYPHLFHSVEGLAIAAGLKKPPEIYVIPEQAMNAFATGRDPENSAIAVTQGLVDKMSRQEMEGVIAHEMSHIKNYDIRVMMLAAILVGLIAMLSHMFLRSLWFRGGSRDRDKGNAGAILLVIGIVLAILAPIVAQLIKLAISRKREYLADATGASLTRYPPGLADALEKIKQDAIPLKHASGATAHLFISNPLKKQMFASAFSTHPPIDERIKRLRSL